LRVVGWRLEVEGGKIEMQRLNSQVSSQNSSPSGESAAGTSAKAGEGFAAGLSFT